MTDQHGPVPFVRGGNQGYSAVWGAASSATCRECKNHIVCQTSRDDNRPIVVLLRHLFHVILLLLSLTFSRYFYYVWNMIDVAILFLFFMYMGVRIDIFSTTASETAFKPEMLGIPEFFFSFSKLKTKFQDAEGILSFIGLLSWVRMLKFFTLLDRFRLLIRVIERTLQDLAVFFSLMTIVVVGFSIAFYSGFYDVEHVPEFNSFVSSVSTLFFMLARGVNLEYLFALNSWLPGILFFFYLLFVYLLLANMFLAIVNDTYTLVNFAMNNK